MHDFHDTKDSSSPTRDTSLRGMRGNRATGVDGARAEAHSTCNVIWWDLWEIPQNAIDGSNALFAWNASLSPG